MHSLKKLKGPRPVKMILSGKSYHEVKELLNVSHSFISEWKNQALFHGVESLRLQLFWETRLLQSKKRKQLSG